MSLVRLAGGTFVRQAMARLLSKTAKVLDPRDDATIFRDFEQDVLERLLAMKTACYGVPVVGVKAHVDGQISVMFMGNGSDGHFRKFSIKFTTTFLADRHYLGDPQAVADIAYQIAAAHQDPTK